MGRLVENFEELPLFVQALLQKKLYTDVVEKFYVYESHISYVVVAGKIALKVKKSVDFGFLNYSTLEKRLYFCKEELRLNSRFCDIYKDVKKIIWKTKEQKESIKFVDLEEACEEGYDAYEYCVFMKSFDPESTLNTFIEKGGRLSENQIRRHAQNIANFHMNVFRRHIPGQGVDYGSEQQILFPVQQNFDQIRALAAGKHFEDRVLEKITLIEKWSLSQHAALRDLMSARRQANMIMECHGDLKLENCFLKNDEIVIFDGIEFNKDLIWIDPLADIALFYSDMLYKGLINEIKIFNNEYFTTAKQKPEIELLLYYVIYRLVVCGKIFFFCFDMTPDKEKAAANIIKWFDICIQCINHEITFA